MLPKPLWFFEGKGHSSTSSACSVQPISWSRTSFLTLSKIMIFPIYFPVITLIESRGGIPPGSGSRDTEAFWISDQLPNLVKRMGGFRSNWGIKWTPDECIAFVECFFFIPSHKQNIDFTYGLGYSHATWIIKWFYTVWIIQLSSTNFPNYLFLIQKIFFIIPAYRFFR